jgi:hypothetical protein
MDMATAACHHWFFMGACIGFVMLGRNELRDTPQLFHNGQLIIFHPRRIFHPDFLMVVVEAWCAFTGIFGLTFSSLLWFLDKNNRGKRRG